MPNTHEARLNRRIGALTGPANARRGRDVLWATGSRVGTQVLQFISIVILARILTPRAFGVVAIAQVFVGFANIFSDLGLGASLVRRSELTKAALSTVFWLNLLTGFVLAGCVALLSLPLSHVFHAPQLVLVLSVAAAQIAVNVTVVPLALLERAFRFRLLALVEIAAGLLALTTSVSMALLGCGPVSLVTGPIAGFGLQSLVLWSIVRIRPGRPGRSEAAEVWKFSGPLVIFNTLLYWARNVDNLVLGIVAGSLALGLYTRAYSLMLVPVQQVTVVLGRVLLPTLSPHKADLQQLKCVYLRALRLSTAITIPLGVGLACLASPLVTVVFGPTWHRMAVMLAILASTTPVQVTVATTAPIYQTLGETKMWSRRSAVTAVVTMVLLCLGAIWGATGVAAAFAMSTFLLAFYAVAQPWRLISLSAAEGIRTVMPALVSALFMASWLVALDALALRWPVGYHLASGPWLLGGVALGVATYVLALAILQRSLLLDLSSAIRRR